ncbi:GNAT family N-acetyltransferase [Massilia sp. PWRC2]|uniref:GNAT family N-acetyltransferase n=1 Tax=Massilia sp. PWRC2 TaxID=2804626 RepID=UPI003CE84723
MTERVLRLATVADIDRLEALIERSARALSGGFYTPAQLDAVTTEVFGVDSQLIADGSYFVIEQDGALLACGGWGMRSTGCGGDKHKTAPERLLDAATESAHIRAFFVDPAHARRGLASQLMAHCEQAAAAAGFRSLQLVATMPGVPLYRKLGFALVEPYELPLSVPVPVALMRRALQA